MQPFVKLLDGIEGGLGIEGIETGLYQKQVSTTFNQCRCLFAISLRHLVKGNTTRSRIVHVGCQRQRLRGGSH